MDPARVHHDAHVNREKTEETYFTGIYRKRPVIRVANNLSSVSKRD